MHPEKRANPRLPHSRGHDIYSLGVLLLEIGLWKNLDGFIDMRLLFEEEEGYGEEGYERVKREFLVLTGRLDGFVLPFFCISFFAYLLLSCF